MNNSGVKAYEKNHNSSQFHPRDNLRCPGSCDRISSTRDKKIQGFANGICVKGKYVYLSDDTSGVKKIDVSDPINPRLVASFETPGEASGIVIHGEYLIIPDSFSLLVLKD